MDVKAVFRLVDVDKSGSISRTVKYKLSIFLFLIGILSSQEAKMATKLLMKRFAIKDVSYTLK